MKHSDKIKLKISEARQRANTLLSKAERSAEESTELEELTTAMTTGESELRAAIVVESADEAEAKAKAPEMPEGDAETRERLQLRGRASFGDFIKAAIAGESLRGASAEYREACGVTGIPLDLFESDAPKPETRATTGTPTTVGVNMQSIRPQVFAGSILPRLNVQMPNVESGTFGESTITTGLTAAARAKDAAATATAATFTTVTTTPKIISARLSINIADEAAVGAANWEAALRQNLYLRLSDELDRQGLVGAGANNDLIGLFHRLAAVTDPTDVVDWGGFVASFADEIDGLWAESPMDVAMVVGPATMQKGAQTFQTAASYAGELSAASYLKLHGGGFWTNKRMPDADGTTNVQEAIVHRMGKNMMPSDSLRTAVCPVWNRQIAIDDIYTDSASGIRHLTLHVLVGDVIVTQPGAYDRAKFKLAP